MRTTYDESLDDIASVSYSGRMSSNSSIINNTDPTNKKL